MDLPFITRPLFHATGLLLCAILFVRSGVGPALAQSDSPFLPPCVPSAVQELPPEEKKSGKKEEGLRLFLSTRCTNTGNVMYWQCLEQDELGTTLIDCNEKRTDTRPGRQVRVTQTQRARIGKVLCGLACR